MEAKCLMFLQMAIFGGSSTAASGEREGGCACLYSRNRKPSYLNTPQRYYEAIPSAWNNVFNASSMASTLIPAAVAAGRFGLSRRSVAIRALKSGRTCSQ